MAVINDLRDFVYGQSPSLSLTVLLDQLKVSRSIAPTAAIARLSSSSVELIVLDYVSGVFVKLL